MKRVDEAPILDQAFRLLVEKRCEVYTQVAGLIMEAEDAIGREDWDRLRYVFEDIRKTLRSSLAFLTDEVYEELERIEATVGLDRLGGEVINAPDLCDRFQLLHVKLSRSLKMPYFQDLEEIIGIPPRLKKRLEDSQAELKEKARRREIDEQTWNSEELARELIGAKHYRKALKHLTNAVRLDPERAVFHNDLGFVYGLLGLYDRAIQEYASAIQLNERFPDRRTPEWTASYFNLGVSYRKAAQEECEAGDAAKGLELYRKAIAALEDYLRATPDGRKVGQARGLVEHLREECVILEGALRARGEEAA